MTMADVFLGTPRIGLEHLQVFVDRWVGQLKWDAIPAANDTVE